MYSLITEQEKIAMNIKTNKTITTDITCELSSGFNACICIDNIEDKFSLSIGSYVMPSMDIKSIKEYRDFLNKAIEIYEQA